MQRRVCPNRRHRLFHLTVSIGVVTTSRVLPGTVLQYSVHNSQGYTKSLCLYKDHREFGMTFC
jgi:hypothetical protein